MKPRRWRFVMIGAVLSLVFAGPIIGAASTLFWSFAADGNDPQRVALNTYREVMRFGYGSRHFEYRQRRDSYAEQLSIIIDRPCEMAFFDRFDDGAIGLISAVDHYRWQRLFDSFDEPAIQALVGLPAPVLGAVAGCIEASLLSMFCARYVVRLVDAANRADGDALRDRRAEIVREVEKMWCAAQVRPVRPAP